MDVRDFIEVEQEDFMDEVLECNEQDLGNHVAWFDKHNEVVGFMTQAQPEHNHKLRFYIRKTNV